MKPYKKLTHRERLISVIGCALILMSALAIISPAMASNPNGPFPRKFFVSRNGDNSDGLTWQTAWNELDQIKWNQIDPRRGDRLEIDGGSSYMYYQTPLVIQRSGTNQQLFRIGMSTEAGHNGRVIIYGGGKNMTGVTVEANGIAFLAGKRGGIMICGWKKNGLLLKEGAGSYSQIDRLEICYNKVNGVIYRSGLFTTLSNCNIHDNQRNVLMDPSKATNSFIKRCWIYNSKYRTGSDGIIVGNGKANPASFVEDCVIGPGLRRGFAFRGADSYTTFVTNCLFINASKTNISTVKGIAVNRCTSYMTSLNKCGQVHGCIAVTRHQPNNTVQRVENSVFYGGRVLVSPTIPFVVNNNTQFRTNGNTAFLSDIQTDPQFVTDVSNYPNDVSIGTLINTDFSLKPGSPAAGTGSRITSVKALVGTK